MGKDSNIEWTEHTFNPWWGCTKVSAGCENCYAQTLAERFGYGECFGKGKPRRTLSEKNWAAPLKWDRAAKAGKRARVFCASMGDVFDLEAPMEERNRLFALMEATPNLQWLVLTKRIERLWILAPYTWLTEGWPKNVAVGVTVENQAAVKRVMVLVDVKARYGIPMVFVSVEPMIGPVDLFKWLEPFQEYDPMLNKTPRPDWVICGCESGKDRRHTRREWIQDLRDQCVASGTPFFLKQRDVYGKLVKMPELDGKVWNEYPEERG